MKMKALIEAKVILANKKVLVILAVVIINNNNIVIVMKTDSIIIRIIIWTEITHNRTTNTTNLNNTPLISNIISVIFLNMISTTHTTLIMKEIGYRRVLITRVSKGEEYPK